MKQKIAYLDGRRLFHVLRGGLDRLLGRQEYLNAINVFPVPDGDTGTNMSATMRGIVEEMKARTSLRIDSMSETMATAAIDHARGNSGMILAQFFQGFSEAVHGHKKLDIHQFADAIVKASTSAKQAVADPVEGTIITVIHSWSQAVKRQADKTKDFLAVLHESFKEAQKAVLRTIDQLPPLKKAGVVDAAAQGFVDVLEGIVEFVSRGNLRSVQQEETEQVHRIYEVHTAHLNPDLRFRYCMECVLEGDALSRDGVLELLVGWGESVVVAGSSTRLRAHLHTNQPHRVFEALEARALVTQQKVDDMLGQIRARDDPSETAVVIDSGCDLPDGMMETLGLHMVPVRVRFGAQEYLDKITLTTRDFFERYARATDHPQTSQPAAGDFQRMFHFLSGQYRNCLVLTLPAGVSGTHRSAVLHLQGAPFEGVEVVDSLSLSVGIGLLAQEVAAMVKTGLCFQAIRDAALDTRDRIREFVVLGNLEAIYRGGRVSGRTKKILDALRVTPVLRITASGRIGMAGVIFGRKGRGRKLAHMVRRRLKGKNVLRWGIAHAHNPAEAEELKQSMRAVFPSAELIETETGAALGAHAGPLSFGLAVCLAPSN